MQNRKAALSDAWKPYLAYPCHPGAPNDRMRAFFTMEVEPQCGMCPAAPERCAIPLPVIRKTGDEVIKA